MNDKIKTSLLVFLVVFALLAFLVFAPGLPASVSPTPCPFLPSAPYSGPQFSSPVEVLSLQQNGAQLQVAGDGLYVGPSQDCSINSSISRWSVIWGANTTYSVSGFTQQQVLQGWLQVENVYVASTPSQAAYAINNNNASIADINKQINSSAQQYAASSGSPVTQGYWRAYENEETKYLSVLKSANTYNLALAQAPTTTVSGVTTTAGPTTAVTTAMQGQQQTTQPQLSSLVSLLMQYWYLIVGGVVVAVIAVLLTSRKPTYRRSR